MNEKITFSDLRKIAASSDLLLELSFPTRSPEYAATILRELEEIIRAAKDYQGSAIVIGAPSKSGLREVFWGSPCS